MTENIFDQTSTLAKDIVSDAIAPRETRPDYPRVDDFKDADGKYDSAAYNEAMAAYNAWRPTDESAVWPHRVGSVREVVIGDVLVVVENEKRRGDYVTNVWQHTTFSDLLTGYQPKGTLAVVIGMSGKSMIVLPLQFGWWAHDLATLERPEGDRVEYYQQRITGTTLRRDVIRTGLSYDELIERIKADERFAQWADGQAQGRALQQAADDEAAAQRAAVAAARKPLQAKADALNSAVSVKVAEVKAYGTPALEVRDLKWIGLGDFYTLASLALEARLLKGEISQQQHDEALTTLRTTFGEEEA